MKKRGIKKLILIIILSVVILLSIIALFYGEITGLLGMTSVNTCSDTDFGKNFEVKGEVNGKLYEEGKLESKLYHHEDQCIDSKILLEYYCATQGIHSYMASARYECIYGCNDGRCLVPEGVEKPAMPCNLWCEFKRIIGIL